MSIITRIPRKIFSRIQLYYKIFKTDNETYYPEAERKSKFQQKLELIRHHMRHHEEEKYYYCYGMDRKGISLKDYIDYPSFRKYRDSRNKTKPFNYICLLRDKDLFSIVGKHYGMPTLCTLGVLEMGTENNQIADILKEHKHLFLKPIDDLCGNGTMCIDEINGEIIVNDKPSTIENLQKIFCSLKGDFLVQSRLIQHPAISEIYPNSINTLRIVTVNPKHSSKPEDVILLTCMLRLGAHGSYVDNWAKGGLIVRVDENGHLGEYGFYKPGYGTRVKEHPDTQTVFKDRIIPYYKEAISLAKQFHTKLKNIHSIGWDVSITKDGPVFIEGNDNWELGFVQICEGGIRAKVEKYFSKH